MLTVRKDVWSNLNRRCYEMFRIFPLWTGTILRICGCVYRCIFHSFVVAFDNTLNYILYVMIVCICICIYIKLDSVNKSPENMFIYVYVLVYFSLFIICAMWVCMHSFSLSFCYAICNTFVFYVWRTIWTIQVGISLLHLLFECVCVFHRQLICFVWLRRLSTNLVQCSSNVRIRNFWHNISLYWS